MLEDLFKQVKTRMGEAVPSVLKGGTRPMSIPSDLLFKCPKCQHVEDADDFIANNKVCSACGYHARLTASERLRLTADPGSFQEYDPDMTSLNPLKFAGYDKKQQELRERTGLRDAVVTGECSIEGSPCAVIVMDSRYLMGSMGSVAGEKITRAFERAAEKGLPVVAFTASGGARMQEGILSLMQMAKTSGAVSRHSEKGLLYITVLTDPTTGGVTASFASLGDIILAEPRVMIGFAGRRVIEGTIRQKLPADFQSAEFMQEHGFVDKIVPRGELTHLLGQLLKLHAPQTTPQEGKEDGSHGQ